MTGDLLLPGLVAKLITTLYNPNNVSEEAAPVTVEMELQVGEQLAAMFGLSCDESVEPCAWGHLTSGGTVANYEALWNFRSLKFYGIALREGARACDWDPEGVGPAAKKLSEYTTWELLNLSIDQTVAIRRQVATLLMKRGGKAEFRKFSVAVRKERIEHLGTAGFFLKHQIQPPRVLVSSSAHYSWAKGMKVLGLGTAHLHEVAVDDHMRMDPAALEAAIEAAVEACAPILCVTGMLGTTEFGTVDPIQSIVESRDRWRAKGVDFPIHVDAAWGKAVGWGGSGHGVARRWQPEREAPMEGGGKSRRPRPDYRTGPSLFSWISWLRPSRSRSRHASSTCSPDPERPRRRGPSGRSSRRNRP